MHDKVKLPKDVAEAIYKLRNTDGHSNDQIIRFIFDPKSNASFKLSEYAGTGHFDILLQALVNGYEVEASPEDKVRDYYYELQLEHEKWSAYNTSINSPYGHELTGCVRTLNLLNIKIEGVNA